MSCSPERVACNANLAPGVNATFGSFHEATAKLSDYYDEQLARQVNKWANRDLRLFGYAPWRPGMDVAQTLKPIQSGLVGEGGQSGP